MTPLAVRMGAVPWSSAVIITCLALAVVVAGLLASWILRRGEGARSGDPAPRDPGRTVAHLARRLREPAVLDLAGALAAGGERVVVVPASSPEAVVRGAPRGAHDLLLVSAPAPGSDGPLYDQATARIARGAGCAVAIYFRRGRPELRRVLVPVHGSPDDEAAVALAARLQAATGCGITLVTGGRRDPVARARALLAAAGAAGVVELACGPTVGPAQRALGTARHHDLVIVSAGRKGEWSPGRLGYFREQLIRACPVSVLLVMMGGGATGAALARIDGGVRGAG